MSNPFAKMQSSTTASPADDKDSLGGGMSVLDTGLYDFKIKMAYSIESSGGAAGVVFEFENDKKQTLRMTEYISSGNDKGNKNFYIDKDSGEEKLLPGYLKVDALCLLASEKELGDQVWEEKLVPIYNFDAKSEVPTKVWVAVSLLGKTVKLGVLKITENKSKKNDSTGKYEPINEPRDINEVNKTFHSVTGKTISEYREQVETASFITKWAEKYGTATIDKYKPVVGGATAGAPAAAGGGKPTSSLFADS